MTITQTDVKGVETIVKEIQELCKDISISVERFHEEYLEME